MKRSFTVSRNTRTGAKSISVKDTDLDTLLDTLEREGVSIDRDKSRKHVSYSKRPVLKSSHRRRKDPNDIKLDWERKGSFVDKYMLRGDVSIDISNHFHSEGGRSGRRNWRPGQYWGPARTFSGVQCDVEAPEELCMKACDVLRQYYEQLQKACDEGEGV